MGPLARIAWRNLGRNPRRTAITAATIAVGVALCVATYGLTDGLSADLVRGATKLDLGHIQIHAPDYPQHRLIRLTMDDPAAVLKAVEAHPDVRAAAPRVYAWALVSHEGTSTGVQLVGVDPARERRVTEILQKLPADARLPEEGTPWPQGRAMTAQEREWDRTVTEHATEKALDELDALPSLGTPPANPAPKQAPAAPLVAAPDRAESRALLAELSPPPAAPPPILLGDKLARIVGARAGDHVYLLSSTVDGLTAEERFLVKGVFRTGTAALDRTRAYVNLRDLQRFVRLDGRVHELALAVDQPAHATAAAAALAADPALRGRVVRTWEQIRPELARMIALNDASVGILLAIVFIIAALGVVNTMVMAVFERTRELGVIIALGLRPVQVLGLVVIETVLLTVVGGIAGTALGIGLDGWLIWHGWDLSAWTQGVSFGGVGINPVLHAALTLKGIFVPLFAMSVVGFIASFYPARRAARLQPTQAMRET